jgi:4-alpha-glucanotransferase
MNLTFKIRYRTTFGQQMLICGNHPQLGNNDPDKAVFMQFANEEEWQFSLDLEVEDRLELEYYYIFRNEKEGFSYPEYKKRQVSLEADQYLFLELRDTWSSPGLVDYAFDTQVFDVLLPRPERESIPMTTPYNAVFEIQAPLISEHQTLCLCGSHPGLGGWNIEWPILMNQIGENRWQAQVQLMPFKGRVEYKYGLYDVQQQQFIGFEGGDNRVLDLEGGHRKGLLKVTDEGFKRSLSASWRGTGVAIPVFSLRSEQGMGVGEFLDLKQMADWGGKVGMKMIQILPINDTTAEHTWIDSYPYAAISVFALHPMYLNIDALPFADEGDRPKRIAAAKKKLNKEAHVDYESVMISKWSFAREIFKEHEKELLKDKGFKQYFKENKHWLVPYAAFCFLRDKYKTADFSKWEEYKTFKKSLINKLVSTRSEVYSEIAIHYFIQYQLHLQLSEAVDYLHQKKLVLKGDIPIGIYRNSVDAWVAPELYHMGMQAGAPPDDFSRKGQNWGFPTYDWERMARDHYDWWRRRFSQLSLYFDAFRIDHILGFFRIWQVPMHAVEGLMGVFEPSIPIHVDEFAQWGIPFDYDRLCRPYITETVLEELFGGKAGAIKTQFLEEDAEGKLVFKKAFDTQRKIEAFYKKKKKATEEDLDIRDKLYELISNFLFIEVEGSGHTLFHPRAVFKFTLSFQHLPKTLQHQCLELYNEYFYKRHEEFWRVHGLKKLPQLKAATNMLICGEDLGMVPQCVPEVMEQLGILSLEVQRMPKKLGETFFHPKTAPYLSVVTPSSHDTSTIRGWWEEDPALIQRFYQEILGQSGKAPESCTPEIVTSIIRQHLHSPAMWAVFPIQDFLGMSPSLRHPDPHAERINIPAIIPHYWRYRMHLPMEQLLEEDAFNEQIKHYLWLAGR